LGAVTQFECVADELEFFFSTEEPKLKVDLGPDGLNLRTIFQFFVAMMPPETVRSFGGEPLSLEQGFDIYVTLYSGIEGESRAVTVKRLHIREAPDAPPPNQNPGPVEIKIEEQEPVKVGDKLTLSLQLDPGASEPLEEDSEILRVAWLSTDGELDRVRGELDQLEGMEDQLETEWSAPEEPGPVRIFATVRDGRGGVAVTHQDLEILPIDR